MVSPLDRKLLRDLAQMRGQVITIALVVACGVAAFATFRSTYGSLQLSKHQYYERQRFADVFAHLERAPEALGRRVEAIEGVSRVYTRVVEGATLPMESLTEPATARVVSLPADGDPPLNGVYLRDGRFPEPGRAGEVVVLHSFADAHGLSPGERLPAVLDGVFRELVIVGVGMSPEYVFPMQMGDISPDPRRSAVLWMERSVMAPAYRMEGAFNDVVLELQPGASELAVLRDLDRLLEPYGGLGAHGRDRQLSSFVLEGELSQLEQFSSVAPLIFLAVAAFLLNVVLSRLVHLQRSQIATLKAVGYSDWAIGAHFLKLVCVIVVLGAGIGLVLGRYLGEAQTNLYLEYFQFPELTYRLDLELATTGIVVSLVAAVTGALGAVRGVVRMPPAEAMRPAPPASYQRSLLEWLGLFRVLGPPARMVVREIQRRPMRTLLSAVGISMAVGILVLARFFYDSMGYLVDLQFQQAWREDAAVTFLGPLPERAVRELAHLPGVLRAEGMRAVPARVRVGHRSRDISILGYAEGGDLRRVVDTEGRVVPLPEDGLVITSKLGEILGVGAGDALTVELREGQRGERVVPVMGLVDEAMGLQGYMRLPALSRLVREESMVSLALLSIDPSAYADVNERLADMPRVGAVTRRDNALERFEEQSASMMLTFAFIMSLFATIIAIGVVYNNARVSLSMRSRDLASLRVLGFTRAEISGILLGELAVQVLLAIPIGLLVGTWMAHGIAATVDPETYRLPIVISEKTYSYAALVTLAAGLVSALLVRRKLDRLDLIGVLKTRE